ncbi:lonely Cys domain-containing protein [Streptomyces cavourensis]|nr:lonely Cys domain-containing protein [Streptomyces cavourensis]
MADRTDPLCGGRRRRARPGGGAAADGTVRELGTEEFIELVAADLAREALPADVPVVLAVPFAADGLLDLPRRLADRIGRTVWAHSGRVTVESAPGEAATIDVVRTPKTPRGDWIASDPGLGPDPDDDVPAWHHEVVSRALVSALTGRQIGRASHHPAEFAEDFEEDDRHLDRMGTFVHDDPATDRLSGAYDLPRPGPEDRAYRLDMHGRPGALILAMRDGTTRDIDEREAGPWLRRRKSLTTLPKDHWVDLVVCWSGRPATAPYPGRAPLPTPTTAPSSPIPWPPSPWASTWPTPPGARYVWPTAPRAPARPTAGTSAPCSPTPGAAATPGPWPAPNRTTTDSTGWPRTPGSAPATPR